MKNVLGETRTSCHLDHDTLECSDTPGHWSPLHHDIAMQARSHNCIISQHSARHLSDQHLTNNPNIKLGATIFGPDSSHKYPFKSSHSNRFSGVLILILVHIILRLSWLKLGAKPNQRIVSVLSVPHWSLLHFRNNLFVNPMSIFFHSAFASHTQWINCWFSWCGLHSRAENVLFNYDVLLYLVTDRSD